MSVSPPGRRSGGSRLLILRGCLVVVVLAATFVVVPAPSARAEHECTEEVEILPNGKVKIIRVCEPHDGGGDGGDGSSVSCEQTFWPLGTEPTGEGGLYGGPLLWWRDIEQREDGSVWGEGYFRCTNLDADEVFESSWWVCYAACGGGGEVPEALDGLLQEALAQVNPPFPGIRHTFDRPADDGSIRAVVNAETWWWAGADHAAIVQADADGPVWVRVTASPGPFTVDPGDGSETLECAGLGVPYNHEQSYWDQVPGEPRGACVHVYERAAESVTATMSVTWMVTYEGFAPGFGNVSGALAPLRREQTATFAVKEIQSVIVR
jgi:hypothetical protein